MYRLVFLIAALSAMTVPARAQDGEAVAELCGADRLAEEIAGSDSWYQMIRIKREHGYLPDLAHRRQIERRIESDTAKLTDALARYGASGGALALVYGAPLQRDEIVRLVRRASIANPSITERLRTTMRDAGEETSCVWLVGPGGIVAADILLASSGDAAELLWVGLDVNARSRSARSPRARDGDCPVEAEEAPPFAAPSETFLRAIRRSLDVAANDVIPARIALALKDLRDPEKRLLILPKGNLRKIPFAALPVGGSPLVELFVPSIVPSVSALSHTPTATPRANADAPSALVIGNPDLGWDPDNCWSTLPGAETEARYVSGKLGGAELVTGGAASNGLVTERLGSGHGFDLIYMATHGVSDLVNPADGSFLALAGGHLRGAQLRNIELVGNPLVIMSACQTGLGKEFDEGVFGLPEAWHFAGSNRIVMSLWDVSDQGTERLMHEFVDTLARQDWRHSDVALARSIRTIRQEHPDPMIWAAFTYYGTPDI